MGISQLFPHNAQTAVKQAQPTNPDPFVSGAGSGHLASTLATRTKVIRIQRIN